MHDELVEHLVAVTTPPTTDQPHGVTTRYEYDVEREHPALRHNLVRAFGGDGELMVENAYGADPMTDDFGRVVYQQFGGFEAAYTATALQVVPRTPEAINVPALRVEVMDPGTLHVMTFNWHGDLLDERFRLAIDGSWRLIATVSRYDEQGNLVERREPEGHGYLYEWDTANADPRARGNLLRATEVASPLKPALGRDILTARYEPRYQLPQSQRDAAGRLTEWVYDYELHPAGSGTGQLRELVHPVVTRPDGTTHRAIERFEHNTGGQLTRHRVGAQDHRFYYSTAAATLGYMRRRRHSAHGSTVEERLEHDRIGNLIARIDGTGNRTTYDVNALGWVEGTQLPGGAWFRFHRNGNGRLVRVEEPAGNAVAPGLTEPFIAHEFRYDALGHVVGEIRGANTDVPRRFRYRTTAEGVVTEAVDPLGRRLSQVVDERGQVIRDELRDTDVTLALVRRFVYTRSGLLAEIVVEGGTTITIDYDGFDQLRKVTAPDGTTLEYDHDRRGLLVETRIAGPGGFPTTGLARRRWERDERGMVRRQLEDVFTDPAGGHSDAVTSLWLDDAGGVERVEEPAGLVRERTLGALGQLLVDQDSLGNSWAWSYDAAGRQTEVKRTETGLSGTLVRSWQQFYDVDGRIRREEDPLGNAINIDYDARGMALQLTNPLGDVLSRRFDAFDHMVEQSLAGARLQFERDPADRVIGMTDPAGSITRYRYDALNRLVRTERADGRIQTRAFTPEGALRQLVDFDGTALLFSPGPVGLPTRIDSVPAGAARATPAVEFDYDGLRRVVRARTGGVSHDFAYDSVGRLRQEDGPDTVQIEWDTAGRERTLTYPDGRRDRARFDELGRLIEVSHLTAGVMATGFSPGDLLASIAWEGPRRPGRIGVGHALDAEFEYDGAGRPTARRYTAAGGAEVYGECRLADGLGFRRTVWQKDPNERGALYTYDPLARITRVRQGLSGNDVPSSGAGLDQAAFDAAAAAASAAPAGSVLEMTYDPGATPARRTETDGAGNLLSERVYTENPLHQLISVDGGPVAYDDAGNLRQFGTRSFAYDAFRRLVEVVDDGATVLSVTYDGIGRVHERTAAGTSVRHAWLGDDLLQFAGAGGVIAQEVPGSSLDQPFVRTSSTGSHLLVHDATGCLMAACDPAGAVEERYRYDPFGKPQIFAPDGVTALNASTTGLEARFGGRPWLPEADLYDYRARVYDPELLLFLQPDPYQFADSWCPYAFVGYNPANFVDPFGAFLNIVGGAFLGAAIGGIGAALSGARGWDIVAAAGAGALGGAVAAAEAPILGAALAGGLVGAWTGGRVGYKMGGATGAVIGAVAGGVAGGGLGAAGGFIGSRIGNSVATGASGLIYSSLARSGASNFLRTGLARYGGQVIGGYAGGTSASVVTNNAAVIGVDVATGREITSTQLWDATVHGFTIDGPLSAVGAPAERFLWLRTLPGNRGNRLGAEGERLVGRWLDLEPANGAQQVVVNGRQRRPDFHTDDTLPRYDEVVEVKNKAELSSRDRAQLGDFETLAGANGADLAVYERPGAGLSSQAPGLTNGRFLPIPQQPLVTTVPTRQLAGVGKGSHE